MKQLIKYTAYIVVCLFSLSASAQIEMEDYLRTAAENNSGLKAKFSNYMAALEKVPQVGALPDPTMAFGYFIQPVETKFGPQKAKISVAQMFPWFGTLNAKENVATQKAKAEFELFEEAKSRLFYDVKSTWYNLYFTSKAIAITRKNIDILNTFRNLALVKIEAGKTSAVDELRVEMELLDLENQLSLLIDKLNDQKISFNLLLNDDVESEIDIPDLLEAGNIFLSKEAIMDSIRMKNHQLLNLEFQEASAAYQQVVNEKMGKPDLKIGMDYIFIGESSNTSLSASQSGKDAIVFPTVGITIPLYRNKYSSMVKEAAFRQEAVSNKKIDKQNILESVYEKANTDYLDAQRRIDLHTRQLELAKKALRILESEYATDGKNFEEILRMERQLLKHNLDLEKARTDLNASIAFINYLMGK